jgi:hypothetical protein
VNAAIAAARTNAVRGRPAHFMGAEASRKRQMS